MTRSLTLAAALVTLTACGSPQTESSSQLAAAGPDLRFASPIVDLALPGVAGLLPVTNGATVSIPCNVSAFRGRYRYGNSGNVGAAAHTNRSHTAGSAAFNFAQAPLAAGIARLAWASFGAVLVPNTPTVIAIRLDSTLAVAESVETNNAWSAKLIRKCP